MIFRFEFFSKIEEDEEEKLGTVISEIFFA